MNSISREGQRMHHQNTNKNNKNEDINLHNDDD